MLAAAKLEPSAPLEGSSPDAPVRQPVEALRDLSYAAAKATVGGRFATAKAAVKDPDFAAADLALVNECVASLKESEAAVRLCKEEEELRKKRLLVETLAAHPESIRTNFDFQEAQFADLMERYGSAKALTMSDAVRRRYAWSFENTSKFDQRFFAWHFQFAVLANLAELSADDSLERTQGGGLMTIIAEQIFGAAAYCLRSISNAVKEQRPEQPIVGRPTLFPRDVEAVLFRFVALCRKHHIPMYKSTIIHYAQRLLEGTEAALGFVCLDDAGEYSSDEEGHLLWDRAKWDNW